MFLFSCLLVLEERRLSDITQKDRKRTSHNNHRLPQTARSGLLFSKSGYTYVGSARRSIDIYRK